jgi:hypothetical protein
MQDCLPFDGPKPRRWQSLVSRIENGEFENERLQSNEIWDVEDLDAYEREVKGITNETNNDIKEENEETIIFIILMNRTLVNKIIIIEIVVNDKVVNKIVIIIIIIN